MEQSKTYRTLRLILGDQLNPQHSWFNEVNPEVRYVFFELTQEQEYVTHHIQKIGAFFLAMRSFADELKKNGHHVSYIKITDKKSSNTFTQNLIDLAKEYKIQEIQYQTPDEYRLMEELNELNDIFKGEVKEFDTEHFYTSKNELKDFFEGKKMLLLENFYRHLRKKHGILMEGDNPTGGEWNYDKENRNKLPDSHHIASLKVFNNNWKDVLNDIKSAHVNYFGNDKKEFIHFPINRDQSLELLDDFLENGLQFFGQFQDALTLKSWRVYHSLISFSLNTKMISPKEVIEKSINFWHQTNQQIDIAQIEGFVRQILGWREYVRGIYWYKMPNYKQKNFLELKNSLPGYYWDGKTKMKCMQHSLGQSLDFAYAHHIQRLMVIGNFSLLAGLNPDEVDAWYLGVYADAIEWVQLPNTRGMSQFADGGIVGTKPYVSSANYINKMGDYCTGCQYNHKETTTKKACPFNSLYWNFLDEHQEKFKNNGRMRMMYSVWNKKKDKVEILEKAQEVLNNIENL